MAQINCPKCSAKLMVTPKGGAVCFSCNYTENSASADLVNKEKQRKTEKQIEISNSESEKSKPDETGQAGSRVNNCADCGGIVSKRANTCPHCGNPNPLETEPTPEAKESSQLVGSVSGSTNKGTKETNRLLRRQIKLQKEEVDYKETIAAYSLLGVIGYYLGSWLGFW